MKSEAKQVAPLAYRFEGRRALDGRRKFDCPQHFPQHIRIVRFDRRDTLPGKSEPANNGISHRNGLGKTGEVVHNIYIRRVEKTNGELRNVEFETFNNVRDPRVAAR